MQFHQRGGLGVVSLQLVQCFVDGDELVQAVLRDQEVLLKLLPPSTRPALGPALAGCPRCCYARPP